MLITSQFTVEWEDNANLTKGRIGNLDAYIKALTSKLFIHIDFFLIALTPYSKPGIYIHFLTESL